MLAALCSASIERGQIKVPVEGTSLFEIPQIATTIFFVVVDVIVYPLSH